MDLTSGAPLWPTLDGLPATYPALHQNRRCDVAVIGGGITGALVSHRFAREGISTVLLEADEIAHGSTAATTALIQYEIDTHLIDLIDRVGADHAVRSYRLCLDAVRGIGDLARAGDDDCAWRSTRSLYLASRRRDRAVLEREWLARRSAGIEVELLDERDIRDRFSFTGPAALLSPLAGELDAYRLTHKLLAEARAAGLEVYDRTRVTAYASKKDGVELRTDGGVRVRARRVVFATGYETPEFLDRKIVRLHSTFALATAPVARFDGWGEDRCLIWETARPYFYARTTGDGRVVMGGADGRSRPRTTATASSPARPPGSKTASPSSSPPFPAMWTGAGAAPSARPGTACPTSAACGNSPTAISRSATEGTGSRSAGSRRTCCSIGSWSGRIGMRSCLGLRDRRAGGRGAYHGSSP